MSFNLKSTCGRVNVTLQTATLQAGYESYDDVAVRAHAIEGGRQFGYSIKCQVRFQSLNGERGRFLASFMMANFN